MKDQKLTPFGTTYNWDRVAWWDGFMSAGEDLKVKLKGEYSRMQNLEIKTFEFSMSYVTWLLRFEFVLNLFWIYYATERQLKVSIWEILSQR